MHWRIEGRVQGVGYRHGTQQEAHRLDLAGWVRNTADGAVELLAEGPDAALKSLEAWCRQGPPGAAVTAIVPVAEGSPDPAPRPFEIRR